MLSEVFHYLWLAVALIAAVAILPGVINLALVTAAALLPKRSRRERGRIPRICVIVPAHNEEKMIAACVDSLLAAIQHVPGSGILVVADNCTDRTAEVAARAGAETLIRNDAQLRGKGYALDFGFEAALGRGYEAVAVVDGDSRVSENFLQSIAGAFARGAQAVQTRYLVDDADGSPRTRLMELAFLAFNVLRPLGRRKLGLSAGLFGNGFALTAEVLRAVPYRAFSIVEDLEYHLQLVRRGFQVEFAGGTEVRGYMPASTAAATVQRSRWEGGRLGVIRAWWPILAGDALRGKWQSTGALFELLTMPLAMHVAVTLALVIAPHPMLRLYGAVSLAIVIGHVLAAARLGGSVWPFLRAALYVPVYVVWKITILPALIASSRSEAQWQRTDRS